MAPETPRNSVPSSRKRFVCVYCGSRDGARPSFLRSARAMGEALARRGLGLVYGGSRIGLMGAVADGALAAGGEVVGYLPEWLVDKEVAHGALTELHVVPSMHLRKAAMESRADAFVALPGGFGTYDELFEILTWGQVGLHAKPVGALDVDGYFGPLRALLRHTVDEGFAVPGNESLLLVEPTPDALLDAILGWTPRPVAPKW
ncbi:MAG: TIGR00730 family Rossman fold protein [Polyangiaceae bacterium]